jgi:hypothetical protein
MQRLRSKQTASLKDRLASFAENKRESFATTKVNWFPYDWPMILTMRPWNVKSEQHGPTSAAAIPASWPTHRYGRQYQREVRELTT